MLIRDQAHPKGIPMNAPPRVTSLPSPLGKVAAEG